MISTVIPVHIRTDADMEYLERALKSLSSQTTPPIEVVLSVDLCPDFDSFEESVRASFKSLNIVFLRHPKPLGISKNSNKGLFVAKGTHVHVLHQDDWLASVSVYESIWAILKEQHDGFLLLTGKRLDRIYSPRFDLTALVGNNQVGGPSGVVFRNFQRQCFDEGLTMLLDVDFVYQIQTALGKPFVINELCIEYGVSDGQAQNLVSSSEFKRELNYIFIKQNLRRSRILLEAFLHHDMQVLLLVSDALLKVNSNIFSRRSMMIVRWFAIQSLRLNRVSRRSFLD